MGITSNKIHTLSERPQISVCVATYNGERYIGEQLESILCQLDSDDEVIISDDCSTDRTVEIINGIGDRRIKLFTNSGKHGYTPNFENALTKANGEYIFLADQDDIWRSDKVEICTNNLINCDLTVSDAVVISESGEIIAESFFFKRKIYKTILGNFFKFGFLGCCMAFKRKILSKALPFPDNSQLCTHDNWLFLVGACFYKFAISDDKLIYYRRHHGTVSSAGLNDNTSLWFKIKYRCYLIYKIVCIKRFK